MNDRRQRCICSDVWYLQSTIDGYMTVQLVCFFVFGAVFTHSGVLG